MILVAVALIQTLPLLGVISQVKWLIGVTGRIVPCSSTQSREHNPLFLWMSLWIGRGACQVRNTGLVSWRSGICGQVPKILLVFYNRKEESLAWNVPLSTGLSTWLFFRLKLAILYVFHLFWGLPCVLWASWYMPEWHLMKLLGETWTSHSVSA